ncbi:MAG: PAS domain-containing protein [Alphaproteobacteria bacterium]|nr:PAS domain-containing protein [Alphaproteobacteria bacterium]
MPSLKKDLRVAGPEREETRQLLKVWRGFRGAKRLPDLEDIRPDELSRFAPNIFVLDIESNDRYILKEIGSLYQKRLTSLNLIGQNFFDLARPAFRERLQARVRVAFNFGFATCRHTLLPVEHHGSWRTENIILPFENSTGGFRRIFAAIYFTEMAASGEHGGAPPENTQILDECFIDLSDGYAAVIDASEPAYSVFPSGLTQER